VFLPDITGGSLSSTRMQMNSSLLQQWLISQGIIMSHRKPKELNRKFTVFPSLPVRKDHQICFSASLFHTSVCHGEKSGGDERTLSHCLSTLIFIKA